MILNETAPEIYDLIFDRMLNIMRLVYIIGCIFCISYFYRQMMGATAKNRQLKYLIPVIYGAVLLLTFYIPVDMPAIAAYGVSAIAAFLASCAAYDSPKSLKLYTALTFLAIQYTVFAVSVNLSYLLLNLKTAFLHGIPLRTAADFIAYLIIELIVRFTEILIIYFAIKTINRQFSGIKDKLTWIETTTLIVPSCALLLCLWLIANAGYFSEEGIMGAASAAAGMISLFCIILIAVLFKKLNIAKASETGAAILLQQTADLKKMYELQETQRKKQTKLLHDYRNQIQTIGMLAKSGKTEELKIFTNKLSEELIIETDGFYVITGNAIIDSVLCAKYIQAQVAGKELIVNLEIIPNEIDSYDLNTVLSNALDNAIEAQISDGESAIKLYGMNRAGVYILIVSNSYSGEIKYESKLPVSTKGDNRGFGLANISAVAAKYNGTMDINTENDKFVLSILLKYK